ncbi:ABC-2 type transport system permease protein [Amycolatopsis xylanica]|uniref:ABC-2 type transport system permease protein n=1 Tax=Amycolatopsis xylanica TaxID=589385 RepID=A0A1H3SDP8_9PSEU|nr:hypothetical protein [Amycolatopsis xylanica]SDZ35725.1 ABC-2 type transport system permease protein [Amycolatopsis xylanica]
MTTALVPRWLVLLRAFARQGVNQRLAYPAGYWMHLVNTVIKMFGVVVVWSVLYSVSASSFPIPLPDMIAYGVVSAVLSELLGWWDGPHFHLAKRVRTGLVTGDLLRPMSVPYQLFCLWLGETLVVAALVVLPVSAVAALAFDVAGPVSALAGIQFVVSVLLAYVLLFCLNFLVGLLVMLTMNLFGLMVLYHAVITMLSGVWIPLWFYPGWLSAVTNWLPFRSIFFTPLSIYVGFADSTQAWRGLGLQVLWTAAAIGAVSLAWRGIRRKLVIQGG